MSDHRRFFINPDQISDAKAVITGETARQIRTVLRLKEGDTIHLLDGSGSEYDAKIEKVAKNEISATIQSAHQCETEPNVRLTLAMCLPKAGKLELIAAKCTELGISQILLVGSERSIPRIEPTKVADKLARLRKIAAEAAEQSGRGKCPEIAGIIGFVELAQHIAEHELALVAWEDEDQVTLKQALNDNKAVRSVLLIIGPEGGLTQAEVGLARAAGAKCVTLGGRVLRCETAAIVACAAVMYELETDCKRGLGHIRGR